MWPRRPWCWVHGPRTESAQRAEEFFVTLIASPDTRRRRKSPWVPTLTGPFPNGQANASSWLGTKNALYYCAQSANSFSWVLFVSSYTTAIVSITACLAHAPKKCTQSGNFQFDIKSPSDFKILSARKLKTVFHEYKLDLTTGIHACIGHVLRKYEGIFKRYHDGWQPRERRMEKGIHIFSVSIVIIPTHLLCQMQANSSGIEFLSTISKFIKRKKILSLLVYVLHKTWN